MIKPAKRTPWWFMIDLSMIVISAIVIGLGFWMGLV
jgi:hypothetical protein